MPFKKWPAILVGVVAVLVAARFAVNARMAEVPFTDMSGKVVVITGGTNGIGKHTTRVLAHWGAHVIVAARNVTKGAA